MTKDASVVMGWSIGMVRGGEGGVFLFSAVEKGIALKTALLATGRE